MDFRVNTAEVAVNETVFSKSCEQSVDCDITLPDYCGDISKVLKCFVRPNITSSSLNSERVTVDGVVLINLLYISDGKLQNYEHSSVFSANLDINCEAAGAMLSVSASTQYVNSRAVSSRRIDVHGAFVINVSLNCCRKEDVVDNAEGMGVEILKDEIMACSAIGSCCENCNISQVIDIGKEKPQIRSILRNTAVAVLTEKKQISNKVLVKGELKLSTLYISVDGNTEREENVLPISQIVNLNGLQEDSITDIDLNLISLVVCAKAGATGEISLLDISAVVSVNVCAYKCIQIPIVTDAYSTMCACECTTKAVNIDRLVTSVDKTVTHTFDVEIGSSVNRVIDVWCDDISSSAVMKDGKLLYTGKFTAFSLLQSESGEISLKQNDSHFEIDGECTSEITGLNCTPRVNILSSDYTLGESTLAIRAVLEVKAVVFDSESISLVDNITLDDSKCKGKQNKMFIYYPEHGESLWSIARTYNTTVKSIVEQNLLDDETVADGNPLVIWCK